METLTVSPSLSFLPAQVLAAIESDSELRQNLSGQAVLAWFHAKVCPAVEVPSIEQQDALEQAMRDAGMCASAITFYIEKAQQATGRARRAQRAQVARA